MGCLLSVANLSPVVEVVQGSEAEILIQWATS